MLKELSLDTLEHLIFNYEYGWRTIEGMFYNNYDIKKFVDEIVKKHPNSRRTVREMLIKNYSIEQIQFLLNNNMYYIEYHDTFDYDIIVKECKNIGYDVTKSYCNDYSIEFLKFLREINTIDECYEILRSRPWSMSIKEFENLCKFLHDKGFTAFEKRITIEKMTLKKLELFFGYGGTKEELIRTLILHL